MTDNDDFTVDKKKKNKGLFYPRVTFYPFSELRQHFTE